MFQPPWCIWPQIWGRQGQETSGSFCWVEGVWWVRVWVSHWELDRHFPPYRERMIRRERAEEGNRYREGQKGSEQRQSHCSHAGLLAAVLMIGGLLPHRYIYYLIFSLNKHLYHISDRGGVPIKLDPLHSTPICIILGTNASLSK